MASLNRQLYGTAAQLRAIEEALVQDCSTEELVRALQTRLCRTNGTHYVSPKLALRLVSTLTGQLADIVSATTSGE